MTSHAVVYTGLGMFSIGSHLFQPEDFAFFELNMGHGTLFESMLRADHLHVRHVLVGERVFLNIAAHMNDVTVRILVCGVSVCNVHLRVLQRAIRRFHRAKLEAQRLAIAMALHPRLGEHSLLGMLGRDMLCCCADGNA